jgi:hypothetical protein
MMHIFFEEDSFGIFLLVSVAMGGGAAWLSGRAVAQTWRPAWHLLAYMLVLGATVRFFHFALFGGTLLSLQYYAVDTAIAIALAGAGFRMTRARQMTRQYGFLNLPS